MGRGHAEELLADAFNSYVPQIHRGLRRPELINRVVEAAIGV